MTSRDGRTTAEEELLDLAEYLTGTGSGDDERRERLVLAVNDVLREVVHDHYELEWQADEGIHLHTPSGLRVWFCPSLGGSGGVCVDVLVMGENDPLLHSRPPGTCAH